MWSGHARSREGKGSEGREIAAWLESRSVVAVPLCQRRAGRPFGFAPGPGVFAAVRRAGLPLNLYGGIPAKGPGGG